MARTRAMRAFTVVALAGITAMVMLSHHAAAAAEAKARFDPVALPKHHPSKHHLRATQHLSVCWNSTSCEEQPVNYFTLFRSGQGVPCMAAPATQDEAEGGLWGGGQDATLEHFIRSRGHANHVAVAEDGCEEVFGLTKDRHGEPLQTTHYLTGTNTGGLEVSDNPDFSSIMEVGGKVFSVVQFEYPRPGTMYLSELAQDARGVLRPRSMRHVDWSHQGGLWIPCAGSLSPWNTHIGGEEYEPDAKYFRAGLNDSTVCGSSSGVCTSIECAEDVIPSTKWNECSELKESYSFAKYLSGVFPAEIQGIEDLRTQLNPYNYGYAYEVRVHEDGSYEAGKWYAVGRRSNELAYIMPDEKTMYLSDDGTNVVFQKFVADEAQNFQSGTLYAAKFHQKTDGSRGGTFDIEWIDLGHATSAEIEAAARNLTFDDIMEVAEPAVDFRAGAGGPRPVCPEGFEAVNAGSAGLECLRVREGMETVASRLESRRYAAMLGATTELTKLEGITYDSKRHRLYAAVSSLTKGMEDEMSYGQPSFKYDLGGENDIKVTQNKCGCVYTMELDSAFTATKMTPLICGDPHSGTDEKNQCNLEEVANPDNVAYLDLFDLLLIAEDTKYHENNVLWAYDPSSGAKERILVAPMGAEVTSPYMYKAGGWGYIMAVAQHPYEYNQHIYDPSSTGKAGHVGVIGPIKLQQ